MSTADTITVLSENQYKIGHRPTYASFGENGLTATATAYGHLLQIAQYFGNNPSGFYCVDLKDLEIFEPYWVTQRMKQLQASIVNPNKGMRLEIQSSNDSELANEVPRLSFLGGRWPKFVTQSAAGNFATEIQYFIHQRTVYQTYTFTPRGESSASLPEMAINAELLIRDLNFTSSSIWNMQEADDNSYEYRAPQEKHCVIRIHKTGIDQSSNVNEQAHNNAVVLAIWPFINDAPQSVRREGTTAKYIITHGNQVLNVPITVTLAYTLHFVPLSKVDDISPPSPPMSILRQLKADTELTESLFANPLFTGDENLDFALKRNLEHVLSVCSIPIGDNTEGTIPPTAITCGDLAGHRVANEASFSAFQFLLLAFRHFHEKLGKHHISCTTQNSTCNTIYCQIRSRIWKVCRGHLKWITDQMETNAGIVASQYWATGQPIRAGQDSKLLKSLMETPFHIIKVAEFCRIAEDGETRDEVQRNPKLIDIIRKWVASLDGENKHGFYAFPRPRKEALIHSFYFPDHAIIWWATKSVEYLGLGQELQVEGSTCGTEHKPRNMSYSSDEIRTNAIKRFTTENPVLKKRMIAISRNTIETRFLIREKETVLFSALDLGLLDKSLSQLKSGASEKINAWANTVDCQAQHEDNRDTQWDHPLQFALAIILASNGTRINSKPAAEMMHYSKSVLLSSSSLNGLFPGQLDEDKEPLIFMKDTVCDSYWHATFEVPYLLWKYAKASSTNAAEINGSSSISTIQAQFSKQESPCMTSRELERAFDQMFERLSAAFFAPGLSTISGKLAIKKSVPFKNFIDHNNIVELQDEWMYNEPNFFNFDCNLSKDCNLPEDCNLREIVRDGKIFAILEEETLHKVGNVITNAINLYKEDREYTFKESPIVGYLIDVPRRSSANKEYNELFITSNSAIYEYVRKKRTPELSKKRLFHFFKADLMTALLCYIASSEKPKISSFFDRHMSYDKYFFDEVTPETNKWITEFHLSFYRILGRDAPSQITGIPLSEGIEYPHHPRIRDGRRISRAAISFRFDGDYFDRYWTCHFFEFNSQEPPESEWERRKVANKHFGAISKENPWRQRRVLELHIVSIMLQEILLSSQTILEEIKTSIQNSVNRKYIGRQPTASALLDTFDLFTKIDNGRFVAISRLWYRFQHILQIVENDLQENLAKISLWNDRERARGHDKPRWTKSDERDYRPIMSRLRAHNDHKYHELQRCYVNISSLNASLSTNLDKMRGDLELRGADDIRLFTYVTVVFLPVGFATGIFSMSDSPSSHTLICMAITAVIALFVTVIALTNAKTLDNRIVGPILRSSRRILYSSVGRPLRIIYSALKIRFHPFIYYFARYIYFPFMNQYTGSGFVMEILEELSGELFEVADSFLPWELAYEDYLKTINKMPKKEGEGNEKDWGDTIGKYAESIPQRMSVRFRGGNKATVEMDSAVGSV